MTRPIPLAIVDLGYGNIGSIRVAFERLGVSPQLTADPNEIATAERVVNALSVVGILRTSSAAPPPRPAAAPPHVGLFRRLRNRLGI